MLSAAETFVVQLGRASQQGKKLLKWVPAQDRDDVIADAVLRCWQAKDSFDPKTMNIETWFAEHLRAARQAQRRDPIHVSTDMLAEAMAPEDTLREAQELEAAEYVRTAMTGTEKQVLSMLSAGSSYKEIRAAIGSEDILTRQMVRKLSKLRDTMPEGRAIVPSGVTAAADPDRERGPSKIDHDIEQLLRRPATEKADCPVCWKCCYFAGLTPKNWQPAKHADPEIELAVQMTEERKIWIGTCGPLG